MPKEPRKFVNPLLQRSTDEQATQQDKKTHTSPSTSTYTSTEENSDKQEIIQSRKRGEQAYEKTHERITLWLDKGLKKKLERLASKERIAKSTLLDEAITDLLKKHE